MFLVKSSRSNICDLSIEFTELIKKAIPKFNRQKAFFTQFLI